MKFIPFFLIVIILISACTTLVLAQQSIENETLNFNDQYLYTIPTVNNFLFKTQKYTGFNFLI